MKQTETKPIETPVCYIFGAGERTGCTVKLAPSDMIIAADGGFDYVNALGLHADFVLGDFDSVTNRHLPPDCIRYPSKKDDTDLVLAVKLGLEKGYTEFVIYGGLGGRLDHTLANIQVLTYIASEGAHGLLVGEDFDIQVITNGSLSFSKDLPENTAGNICSVFSLSEESRNVHIEGFEYEASDITLTNSFPLGISNTFTGKNAYISVEKGTLAILSYRQPLPAQKEKSTNPQQFSE